jgi:hypothetical protein
MAGQAALLKPSTFVEGGGLPGDIDVTFKEVKFVLWDYNGKIPTANPAMFVKMQEDSGEEHDQWWSSGQSKDWVPSEDGKTLVAVGSATGLNTNSNAGMLITSIVNAGFPEDKIDGDVTVFQGLRCHVIRQPVKREGLTREPRADGKVFESTVLVVSKIHSLPWEKSSATGKAATGTTVASGTSGGNGAAGGTLEETASGVVMEILMAEGKHIPKQQLVTKVFQKVKGNPECNKIVQLVNKDEFLGSGPWTLNGGVVSMG